MGLINGPTHAPDFLICCLLRISSFSKMAFLQLVDSATQRSILRKKAEADDDDVRYFRMVVAEHFKVRDLARVRFLYAAPGAKEGDLTDVRLDEAHAAAVKGGEPAPQLFQCQHTWFTTPLLQLEVSVVGGHSSSGTAQRQSGVEQASANKQQVEDTHTVEDEPGLLGTQLQRLKQEVSMMGGVMP